MKKAITFKEMMHEPMLIEGSGEYEKLSEKLGENNADRLTNLGVITVVNGSFQVTEGGKKLIELYNRKQ